jgi:hypothetical protein
MFERHLPTRPVQALKNIKQPSNVLKHPTKNKLYVASFMTNQVLTMKTARSGVRRKRGSSLTVFASGVYCKPDKPCAMLDGPWGMAINDNKLYVASFGTDQILFFDIESQDYLGAFGDSDVLDCPEGMAFSRNGILFVVSNLRNEVVSFDTSLVKTPVVGVYRSAHLDSPEDVVLVEAEQTLAISSHSNNSIVLIDVRTSDTTQVLHRGEIGGINRSPVRDSEAAGKVGEGGKGGEGGEGGNTGDTGNTGGGTGGAGDAGDDEGGEGGEVNFVMGQDMGSFGPVGLLADANGSLYCASYQTGEIVRFWRDVSDPAGGYSYKGVYASGGGLHGACHAYT